MTTARQLAEEKAVVCIRVATAMMPNASVDAIEAKALELMDVTDKELQATLDTLILVASGKREPKRLPHHEATKLAEKLAAANWDGVKLKVIEDLDPVQRRDVETLAKNPCRVCGTYQLEKDWVGSAYCSLRCCMAEKRDLNYAESILKHYEAHHGVRVCRACHGVDSIDEEMASFLRQDDVLRAPLHEQKWPQHECSRCGELTPARYGGMP